MTGYVEGNLTDRRRHRPAARDRASVDRGGSPARLPAAQPARHRPGRPRPARRAGRGGHRTDVAARSRTPWAARGAGGRDGVVFTLENLNTAVDHPGTPFAQGSGHAGTCEAVDSPGLRMNLDLYHAQIGEGNLIDCVGRCLPWIGEIQVADVPGRCEPGTGEINYPRRRRARSTVSATAVWSGWRAGRRATRTSPCGASGTRSRSRRERVPVAVVPQWTGCR